MTVFLLVPETKTDTNLYNPTVTENG